MKERLHRVQAKGKERNKGCDVLGLARLIWPRRFGAQATLSLIVEDSLQPFGKRSGRVVTRDMHLHDLPWTKEALQQLGETEVEMTVTLTYFIEPDPSSRLAGQSF